MRIQKILQKCCYADYNLLEDSDNCLKGLVSLWNYYANEVNGDANENNAGDYRMNNNKTTTRGSFK